MNPLLNILVGPIFETMNKVIDRLWPDPTEAAKAKLELFKMQQAGELKELDASLQLALAQIETNKAEAASGSAYAAGWRPTMGYICCAAFGYQFLIYPMVNYYMTITHSGFVPPTLGDTSALWTVLCGMLGIGVMRSWEKTKGVAT